MTVCTLSCYFRYRAHPQHHPTTLKGPPMLTQASTHPILNPINISFAALVLIIVTTVVTREWLVDRRASHRPVTSRDWRSLSTIATIYVLAVSLIV